MIVPSSKSLSLTTQIRMAIGFYALVCTAVVVAYVAHDPVAFAHGDRALPVVLVVAALSCAAAYGATKGRLVNRALLRAVRNATEGDFETARRTVKEVESNFYPFDRLFPRGVAQGIALVESFISAGTGDYSVAVAALERIQVASVKPPWRRAVVLDEKAYNVALAGDGRRALAIAEEATMLIPLAGPRAEMLRHAIHRTKAVAHVVTGEFAQALALFGSMQPSTDPGGRACMDYHYAQAQLAQGDRDQAVLLFERATREQTASGEPPLWAKRAASRLAELRGNPHRGS